MAIHVLFGMTSLYLNWAHILSVWTINHIALASVSGLWLYSPMAYDGMHWYSIGYHSMMWLGFLQHWRRGSNFFCYHKVILQYNIPVSKTIRWTKSKTRTCNTTLLATTLTKQGPDCLFVLDVCSHVKSKNPQWEFLKQSWCKVQGWLTRSYMTLTKREQLGQTATSSPSSSCFYIGQA